MEGISWQGEFEQKVNHQLVSQLPPWWGVEGVGRVSGGGTL